MATRSWPSKHDARLYCGSQQSQFALFFCSRRSRHGYLIKGLEFSFTSLRGDILTSPSLCEALPMPGKTALQSGMLGASPAPRLFPNNPQTPSRASFHDRFIISDRLFLFAVFVFALTDVLAQNEVFAALPLRRRRRHGRFIFICPSVILVILAIRNLEFCLSKLSLMSG